MPILTNAFRVSFAFEQLSTKKPGWTENFHNSTTDVTIASARGETLRTLLVASKGTQTWCPKYRVSSLVNFRQVEPWYYRASGPTNSAANPDDSDYPTSKIQLKLTGGGRTTTQWMGGILDSQINRGGFYSPSGANVSAMNALFAHLRDGANGWCLYGLTNQPRVPITAFAPATGVVTTAVAHALVNGDSVRISRAKGNTAINAVWSITLIDTTHFSLNFWEPSTTALTKSKAQVQKQDYGLTQITAAKAGQASSHAVGRPTGLAGGKRKKKKTA